MDDTRYAYAVARVRALEPRLLDHQMMARMLAEDAPTMLRALGETDYGDFLAEVREPREAEPAFTQELDRVLSLLVEIAPVRELLELFRQRYDFHNAQCLLKSLRTGADVANALLPLGTLPVDMLRDRLAEKQYHRLPEWLGGAAQAAVDQYETRETLVTLANVLDQAWWGHALAVTEEFGNEFLQQFLQMQIDLTNISHFGRAREWGLSAEDLVATLVPGGTVETGHYEQHLGDTLAVFTSEMGGTPYRELVNEAFSSWPDDGLFARLDRLIDDHVIRFLEPANYIVFGIEPLLAYLCHKELEIKTLRTLLVGKLNGLSREALSETLRSIYA